MGGRLDARVKPDVTKPQVVFGADSSYFVKKVKACDDRLPLQWSPFAYVIKYSIYGGKLSVPRKNTNGFFKNCHLFWHVPHPFCHMLV